MQLRLSALGLAVTAALAAPAAGAQPATQASIAAPAFRSALDGYQPFSDQQVAPWKEMNDTVGRIGGWRVYAKEARNGAKPSQASTPAEAAPARAPAAPEAKPDPAPSRTAPGHPMH